MKCDESKPTCQQCSRRGVDCGGYPNHLRWRPVAQGTNNSVSQPSQLQTAPAKNRLTQKDVHSGPSQSQQLQPGGSSQESERTLWNDLTFSRGLNDSLPSFSAMPHIERTKLVSSDQDESHIMYGEGSTPAETALQPPTLTALIDSVFSNSPNSVDFGRFLLPHELDGNSYQSSSTHRNSLQEQLETIDCNGDDWNMYGLEELLRGTDVPFDHDTGSLVLQEADLGLDLDTAQTLSAMLPEPAGVDDIPSSMPNPQPESVTHETIQHLFENGTCHVLSIKEDQTRNPWRTLIWPLAVQNPALYHALAAMACFHICKLQPQMRLPGQQHFEKATKALADNSSITLEARAATELALALAASWDYEASPTVIEHTNAARILIRQAGSGEHASKLAPYELSRLSFLANTCMYMDVIARITHVGTLSSNDHEFMTACSTLSSSIPSQQQLDPLMGCAITLFPLIGRLGELVGNVRKRIEKRNSPALISKATELRKAVENWVPSIDMEGPVELDINLTDSIQTAEAYRWASLLLLRQAVPEMPWAQSIWKLASKSLIFIATISISSRTTLIQILPLMLAGCEAWEEDDKDWVRERWDRMSKYMIGGIVDRCRKITEEVWRRRDEFELNHGLDFTSPQSSPLTEPSSLLKTGPTAKHPTPAPGTQATESLDSMVRQHSDDFPESAAFKKGIDPFTRAGNLHYLVKGDLHCFAVMRDWDWHGMYSFYVHVASTQQI